MSANPRKPLLTFRLHCEYSPDSGHVELLGAIVAIDTVLFLLDIGQLGIAETADVLGHGDDSSCGGALLLPGFPGWKLHWSPLPSGNTVQD